MIRNLRPVKMVCLDCRHEWTAFKGDGGIVPRKGIILTGENCPQCGGTNKKEKASIKEIIFQVFNKFL